MDQLTNEKTSYFDGIKLWKQLAEAGMTMEAVAVFEKLARKPEQRKFPSGFSICRDSGTARSGRRA